MALFSSRRERRLWIWTAIVVVAIYSTLGLATKLAKSFEDSSLGVPLFITGCLLVLLAIVTQGLTTRPTVAELAVAMGVAAAYLLLFVRMSIPAERTHVIEYGVVAILIFEALKERVTHGVHVRMPAVLAILAASLVGIVDECIQFYLPSRVFDPIDMLFNVLAATMAVTASITLAWARRRATRSTVEDRT